MIENVSRNGEDTNLRGLLIKGSESKTFQFKFNNDFHSVLMSVNNI